MKKKRENNNRVIETLLDPFQRFLQIEASGGIMLLFFTILALVWANSPWADIYHHLWEKELSFKVGTFYLSKARQEAVSCNDEICRRGGEI